MSYFLILNPHRVREFLKVNESFLRALIKEPPRTNKRGRKRMRESIALEGRAIIRCILRKSVEHVFGLLKLSLPPILDRLPTTILTQYSLQSSNLLQL